MAAELRRVALNAVFLRPQMGGMVTYTHRVIESLVRIAPGVHLTVLCAAGQQDAFAGYGWSGEVEVVAHPLLGRRYVSAVSEVGLVNRVARAHDADVIHSLAMTGPVRSSAAHVVTIPDLIWLSHASSGVLAITTWKALVPRVARRAGRVITFSGASRNDIVEKLRVPAGFIDVIPLAADRADILSAPPNEAVRERFGLEASPVVLSVSSLRTHKNLVRLVQAMGKVARTSPGAVLVVPGLRGPQTEEVVRVAREAGARLVLPGWVSDAELEGLYAIASCVVQPALQEGFGLPVLEAMQRGVPVACSNVSSLPEVGGPAAAYFDPFDVGAIAAVIIEVMRGGEAVRERVRIGLERAAGFTWERVGQAHLESYRRALAARA
jgi:glycosyltransferase involved in cell wall biosynthesis